jgi:predicted transcriptional regulator
VRAGNLARYRPRREHLCRSCGAPDHNARTCPQRKKNLGRGRIVQDMILTMLHLREARTLKALATETHIAWRTQYRIVEQLVEAGIPIRQVDTSATGAAVYQLDKEAMRLLLRL